MGDAKKGYSPKKKKQVEVSQLCNFIDSKEKRAPLNKEKKKPAMRMGSKKEKSPTRKGKEQEKMRTPRERGSRLYYEKKQSLPGGTAVDHYSAAKILINSKRHEGGVERNGRGRAGGYASAANSKITTTPPRRRLKKR